MYMYNVAGTICSSVLLIRPPVPCMSTLISPGTLFSTGIDFYLSALLQSMATYHSIKHLQIA